MYFDASLNQCDNCEGSGFIKNNVPKNVRPIKIVTNEILEKISPFKTCDDCHGTGKSDYKEVLDRVCCTNN